MTAFVDTNVLIRHLTGDPPDLALRATEFLRHTGELLLADVIIAETVYVLESFYELARRDVAELIRAVVALPAITVGAEDLVLRATEVYEVDRLDFADAYLIASAERSGVGAVVSCDRSIDRVTTVERIEP